MYQVILYAAIATIICVMLYSVLGKNVGQGPEAGFDPTKMMDPPEDKPGRVEPVEADDHMPELRDIMKADGDFSPAYFIDGAKAAYAMILEAFASGDKEQLQMLLTEDVYTVYADAIDQREAENLTQVTDLARLMNVEIIAAETVGQVARITVRFDAEQSSALVDSDGQTVQGDPDLLSRITEDWTFERDMKSRDPNWKLSEVAPSEGDDLEVDPTPDTKA